MLGSEGYTLILGAIFGGFPKCSSIAHLQSSTPTRANTKKFMSVSWSLSKLGDCSPLALFLIKASQTSSCRVTTSTKIPLREKDSFFGYVVNDHCRFPYCLLPYVMVRLGPEGTTILISMSIEVMDHSTSQYTVTIPVEELEGRCNLLELTCILSKLVSLSFSCLVLNVSSRIAHLLSDVAYIFVVG
ncbi:hypothetical protein Bca52824_003787 [Brassica carinata]|uniref:Uncharacterized protein n=1 Tax=Brassica carinata TaxID=52824 RepID=A0A8X8BG41_BRACI|nr:hypothetical protein Bca52824_003787 [Brassica carinata]